MINSTTKNVIIDCDPGIDDAVAILFALSHPLLNIRAITTVSGNLLADICSKNARKILHLSGHAEARLIPVAGGPLRPLVRPYPRDPFSHGADGLGDLDITDDGGLEETRRFAPDLILETVEKYYKCQGGVSIICLGPLTNIALALMKDATLPSKVSEMYHIGGLFGFNNAGSVRATGGNPVSEWNVYVDPEAADIVFRAGFNLVALGLDVTTRPDIELSAEHRVKLHGAAEDGSACPRFLLDVIRFGELRQFASWCCLIDSVAVAVAVDPTLVVCEEISVAVETQSTLSLGQTIVDRRERKDHRWKEEKRIKAAKDIDASRFLDLLVATLVGDTPRQ
ncbi:Pyrimidine-specific ribonucleoside hydrolase RihA [Talaromyces pinophilus]|nr:Pyrimidine-specific ribonucleoside hydrolase RihA [Talaromyces pinophilus]